MTIKELKDILQDWPEIDENGKPFEVWIETGWCLSSLVVDVDPLNRNDIILASNAFENPEILK